MRNKFVVLLNLFIFSLFSFLLLGSETVLGLGVSPGRVTMTFSPNYVYEGQACYVAAGITRLRISQGGYLNDYLTLENVDENNELITTETNCVKYRLKLPPKIDEPGPHRTFIWAVEVAESSGGGIVALVRIEHQIDVFVPYPGKYLEYYFSAGNVKAGEAAPFDVTVISKGVETVKAAQGFITIYDQNNKSLGVVNTQIERDIATDQQRTLQAKWNSSGNREGRYNATLKLVYDDITGNASAKFKLGALDIILINYTREVIIGGIREFYVLVDSIWADEIQNVRAIVSVFNYSNSAEKPLASFETLTRNIPPWGTENLKGYVDATNLSLGEYDLKMNLFFATTNKTYDGKLRVIAEPKIKAPAKKLNLFTTKNLLIALGVVLIVFIILLIITLVPKKKKEDKEQGTKPR
jgi:hypothetical protein